MSRAKVFTSILMVLVLIALSGASVWAAPGGQEGDQGQFSGVVTDIVIEVDEETGTTTVLVTLLVDETTDETQTVRLSLEAAIGYGLVTENENMTNQPVEIPDPDDPSNVISGEVQAIAIEVDEETGATTVLVTLLVDGTEQEFSLSLETASGLGLLTRNEGMIDQPVNIEPGDVIEEDEEEGEEALHPVASALTEFFAGALGLDDDTIMGRHEEGFGFGVIAQACWMSFALEGDAELLGAILDAKRDHDFSDIDLSSLGLSDEDPPKNWGQFKRVVLGSKKAQRNLGEIMSGRAEPLLDETGDENELGATATEGKVKGKKDKAGGKPEIPPGQEKDKDKGGGPPAEPPGKVKNEDKGKGGGKKK